MLRVIMAMGASVRYCYRNALRRLIMDSMSLTRVRGASIRCAKRIWSAISSTCAWGRGVDGSHYDVGICRGVPLAQSDAAKDPQVRAIIDVSLYGDMALVTPMLVSHVTHADQSARS